MFPRLFPFVFAVLVNLCAFSATAEAQRWVRITQHDVAQDATQETIDLSGARGSFLSFRLRARGGQINFEQFVLNFHDNTLYVSEAPFSLRSGERTKILADDNRSGRFPENLMVTYKAGETNGRYAKLEVWGLQSRQGRYAERPAEPMPTPPPPPRVGVAEPDAEEDDSVLIALATPEREADAATIKVEGQPGKFKRLRLAVRDEALDLDRLTVTFEDGGSKDFAVTGSLRANTSTPWFEIDGDKFVSSVELKLREKTPLASAARLELYGTHTEGWLDENGEGGRFNDGWLLIGAQTAGFIGFDNDIIPLAEHGVGFGQLRLNVLGRPITLNQLRVVYENGEEDIVPVRSRIDDGDIYGPIALRGDGQKIREIRARYRTRLIDEAIRAKGAALVQIWAKR